MKKNNDPKSIKKYVFYQHIPSGRHSEMNWWEWEQIQRDPYRAKDFKMVRVVDLGLDNPRVEVGIATPPPIIDDPLECPLCGFSAKSELGLMAHKRKHLGQNAKKQSIQSEVKTEPTPEE